MERPKLFDYLHVVSYLRDYYNFRKKQDNGFSYEAWSTEIGYKSRSYIRMVLLEQKRVTASFEEAFAVSEKLSPREVEYWHFLILYSQAKNHDDRQLYGRKLTQILSQESGQKEIADHFDFLSNPIHPKLLVLLGFEDISRDAQTLAGLLKLDPPTVLKSLRKLEELGLAAVDESLQWRALAKRFKVPQKLNDAALSSFHRSTLVEAMKHLDTPPEARRFRSLLLPMDTQERAEFLDLLDTFAAELFTKYSQTDNYGQRRVYQINFNVFPISEASAQPLAITQQPVSTKIN